MILVGRYLSPFVRRVAISLHQFGIAYQHSPLTTADDRAAIGRVNPLVRVPALVLDDGEVLIDSWAILDHLDELAGPRQALTPPGGPQRRQVNKLVALALGAAEKGVTAHYERNRRPAEKSWQGWIDQCAGQIEGGLAAIEQAADSGWLVGERMTQADVTAVVTWGFLTKVLPDLVPVGRFSRLEALVGRCEELPAFIATRP